MQKAENLLCRLALRVDDERKAELAAHHVELFSVFRAAHTRDGVQRGVHFSCCKTAQQVDFIGACGGDEHFCLLYLRFVQRGHGGAVAHHGHDVELLHIPFQNRPIGIDGHKVVALL